MPEAVWFGGPQRVEIRQEPAAPVGPDDVRVRALVSGVSAGSELLVYRGSAPPELQPDLPTVRGDFGFPIKFAYACVGRVIEVGSRVSALGVDDLVFVHHPHQTEFVVPADFPIRLPKGSQPMSGCSPRTSRRRSRSYSTPTPGSEKRSS